MNKTSLDDYLAQMRRDENNANAESAEALAVLKQILEAVRALKPAPQFEETPNEKAWRERAVSAERALLDYEGKPMPYSGRTRLAKSEAEIERLRAELEHVKADRRRGCENANAEIRELRAENELIRKSIGEGDYGPTAAELKLFREREVELERFWRDLQFLIERHPDTREVPWNMLSARIAAVRDFKITT